jgi:hypothetical protein
MPLALILALSLVPPVGVGETQDHAHAGRAEDLGHVDFPVSCSPRAQRQFNLAVAMLHSFWYERTEGAFLQVARIDPSCAMAYWGVAMSLWHPLWTPPDAASLRAGLEAVAKARGLAPTEPRERGFIEAIAAFYEDSDTRDHRTRALAYEHAMEGLHARFPKDDEVSAFYALALLATAPPADKTYANQLKAAALLEPIFKRHPRHPGAAHYIIHAFDTPALAPRALAAARSYAKIAPSAPHALHMPSHIFTRLGLWPESIASNLASAAAAARFSAESHMGGVWDEQLHAMDYLEYAYLQRADDRRAKDVVDQLEAITSFAQHNWKTGYALAAIPARYAIERGQWAEAAALKDPPVAVAWSQAIVDFARGYGLARLGDGSGAEGEVGALERIRDGLRSAKETYWADQVEVQRLAVAAWAAHAAGRESDSIPLMKASADLEDSTEKLPVTPGPIVPARELLGEMLLEVKRPREAFDAFRAALRESPDRFGSLAGAARAAAMAGDLAEAQGYAARLDAITAPGESTRAVLGEVRKLLVPAPAPSARPPAKR